MDKTLQVQLQIRQNAEEVSSALKEIGQWEKTIKQKDRKVTKSTPKPRVTTTTTAAATGDVAPPLSQLRTGGGTVPLKVTSHGQDISLPQRDTSQLTPASIVNSDQVHLPEASAIPKARGKFEYRDLEEVERERGNQEFKAGNFTSAAKCYTKCLGLKSKNYIAFSNRAMAYLKMKEYSRAVLDCNSALHIEPNHVKTLMRRSTAFNALGKHRAALKDLLRAAELEPANKQMKVDIQQTKEQLRSAVNRAPLVEVSCLDIDAIFTANNGESSECSKETMEAIQGPDPLPDGSSMKYEEPEIQDGFQRIQILDDEEEEWEPEPVHAASAPSSSSTKIQKHDGVLEDPSSYSFTIRQDANTTPSSAMKAKTKSKDTKKDIVSTVTGAYELEKTLLQVQKDDKLLTKFIQGLKRKSLCATLSKSQQLEPSVVFLLLRAVGEVYGRIKNNWVKIVDWYESISQLSSFRLLFQLMVTEERTELQRRIQQAFDNLNENLSGENAVQLQTQQRLLFKSFEI